MREISLVLFLVEIFRLVVFAGMLRVLAQIVFAAMRHAFKLAKARRGERKLVLNVAGARANFGVVGQLVAVMLAQLQVAAGQANGLPPCKALVAPPGVPLRGLVWLNEELQFHLLKLATAECEIARGDFIAKRFSNLRNSKRHANARAVDHIVKVGENALRSFWAQVRGVGRIFNRAHIGLEHQVELARLGQSSRFLGFRANATRALVGAERGESANQVASGVKHFASLILQQNLFRLGALLCVVVNKRVQARAVFGRAKHHQVIGAVARFAFAAIHHWIVEAADMARGHPHFWIHDDG